jgi:hypothetical protein
MRTLRRGIGERRRTWSTTRSKAGGRSVDDITALHLCHRK